MIFQWVDKITNPPESPVVRKPLYYWEMHEYWRKSPPKMTNSPSNLQERLADIDLDAILADFHILLSKQEVEELLVTNSQTRPNVPRNEEMC
jgi:hypothetical protein